MNNSIPLAGIIEVYKAPVMTRLLTAVWPRPQEFKPTPPESKFKTVAIFKVKMKAL